MENKGFLLACVYCGDTMDIPSQRVLEKFGDGALECCEYQMVKINTNNLYNLVKGLEKLKKTFEDEITKDF